MSIQRRTTKQRKLVLELVRSMDSHPTADDVWQAAREQGSTISRGTVYRNLALLSEEGAIQTIKTPGGSRFDWRCDDHAHVVCSSCGAVADIALPHERELDRAASQASGYDVRSHYTIFEGLCPACREAAHKAPQSKKAAGARTGTDTAAAHSMPS